MTTPAPSFGSGYPHFKRVHWRSLAHLKYVVGHVFLPAHRGYTIPHGPSNKNDKDFVRAVCATAHAYSHLIDDTLESQWRCITKMLDFLQAFLQPGRLSSDQVASQLREMQTGDIVMLLNRAQDLAVVLTKLGSGILYELLKVFGATSKGLYRECAIEISDDMFHDHFFRSELADFLLHLDGFPAHHDTLENIAPRPIELLTGILQGVGRSTMAPLSLNRANSHYKLQIWDRSQLWLFIKVAIKTSLASSNLGNVCYKMFLLFFMCSLAEDAKDAKLSSHILHAISVKILRRFKKLGSSSPDWLRDIVVKTSASLRDILEVRWKEIEAVQHLFALWDPSRLDLAGDMVLTLVRSKEYIRNSLTNPEAKFPGSSYCPKHIPRGTLDIMLSSNGSFFEKAFRADPYVALYDLEYAVEHGIDDWVAGVTDVDQACVQVATLMEIYLSNARDKYKSNPECLSIMILTGIELLAAVDKLAVEAFPVLAGYSVWTPTELLHRLHFREGVNLYRFSRAYQYLSARHSQFRSQHFILEEFIAEVFPLHHPANLSYGLDIRDFWRNLVNEFYMPLHVAVWCSCGRLLSLENSAFSDVFAYRLQLYPALNQHMKATSHTSNDVFAAQMQCPDDLSVHEFVAFGHLRSGGSLQWVNILRELRSRTLNFRRHDVHFLLVQAAAQVGPLDMNTGEWLWHQELQETSFCHALLDEAESLLVDVAVHSLDGVMMNTISFLLTRLLGSNPSENVEERTMELLLRIRKKTFHWAMELSYNLIVTLTNTGRSDLLRDMAAICRSTFDVGSSKIHKVLRSAEDIGALLFCAILIRANIPLRDAQSISIYSQLLLERNCRLSLALESILRDVILSDGSNRGVDFAVRKVWFGYCPGPHGWRVLPHPNSHWLTSKTAPGEYRRSQKVHLNLLNGTLLVDSKPIAGLPYKIREHPTYKRIFGDKYFLAIASDLPEMDLCSLTTISDHRVHFALQDNNLVIRAQHKESTDILEVIHHETLGKDLPATFVIGHVHWLNLSTSIIEIRPLDRIWEQSPENWRINCASALYRMCKGREYLVDIRSQTCKMISSRLGRLDAPENLVITTSLTDIPQSSSIHRISIVLPRYGLSFFVNTDGELESRDFKDMVYDENQCIGALFGLENRLVLRPKFLAGLDLVPRCVIIPEGELHRQQLKEHVRVRIVFDGLSTRSVSHHAYHVNTDLGCLVGYASRRSRLYLARLHAETSVDWMPDPLTGRTGIEEALSLLQSAGCRSIMEHTRPEEAGLGHPFSSDHETYPLIRFSVREIEYFIERERFLRNGDSESRLPSPPDLDVLGTLRTAYLFPSEVITSKLPPMHVFYPPRIGSLQPNCARTISHATYHWIVKTKALSVDPGSAHTSLRTPAWSLNPDHDPPLIPEVEDLLREAMETRQQCRLLFFLPIILYGRKDFSHYYSILAGLASRALGNHRRGKELDVAWLQAHFSGCQCHPNLQEDFARQFQSINLQGELYQSQSSPAPRLWHRLLRRAPDLPLKLQPQIQWQVTLHQLFCERSAPKILPPVRFQRRSSEGNRLASSPVSPGLNQFFNFLQTNEVQFPFQRQYITHLHYSAQHVHEAPYLATVRPSTEELMKYYEQCRDNYVAGLAVVRKGLCPVDDALDQLWQWPLITPITLFRCLASTSTIKLPNDWKQCIVSLALLLLELQRSRRLVRFALDDLEEELFRELANEGCCGWNSEDFPDWLLIQLQGDFLVRKIQADVAMSMISPPFGENIVMQVNMGEGKSSVILPISAVALADGKQLVRVIVPKALSVQMFRLLVDRLGGLVNRPIYHLSFSRSLASGYSGVHFETLRDLLSECIRNRGVLVVQPEHILSFKLTSVEGQLREHSNSTLFELQRWIDSCARDIMDESDEVLHPRFQLTYAVGLQRNMEGYPDRWTITQQVLKLTRNRVASLLRTLPDAIECEHSPSGSFPRISILRPSDTREHLISSMVNDVMKGRLPGFSLRDIDRNQHLRNAVRVFISSKEVYKPTAKIVEEHARKTGLWDGILLLRGLFACDILWFALAERRWRVDYGLSPNRTLLAVPYRAKDVPAPAAEFGHPDITVVLTCLSYYYGGLTEEQLRASFKLLQEQDDPSKEYSKWLRDHDLHSLPKFIQDLSSVNTRSSEQWDRYLFPLFSRSQAAVDFYLSRVVFPKEAKEFPWKLSASSWDLAEVRERPITGFSGTNDNQYLLPTSIAQRDPDHQLGSNARVLTYLLQPENNFYVLISGLNGERLTTLELLKMVVNQEPKIRVLLDVGAQILDLSNYEVAKAWLELSSDSDGAVYFNEVDELMILTKNGSKWSLASSPLAQQLDRCVVYLDDAHTRGTDLKLPPASRAAVTLGPKVTKDRLVQGCMRMRKLGHGHSVMFLTPLEVDRSIRAVAAVNDQNIPITTTDILRWTVHETWSDIQQRAPYWAQQGVNHKARYDAWSRFCNTPKQFPFWGSKRAQKMLANAWLQPEVKSLVNLYALFQHRKTTISLSALDGPPGLLQHCINLGVIKLPEAQIDEEQEREVNREIECEQEAQRHPSNTKSASHALHPDVVAFVRTGSFPVLHNGAFHPVFTTLEGSSAATTNASIWNPSVLATKDFCKTVELASSNGGMDQFLRPVQWVLSGKWHHDRILVLLSPFEADRLMPDIRLSKHVHLHAYTPRMSESMRPADDLMLYIIPPVPDNWTPPWDLIDQLNLFAGQLYLRDYDSYLRTRRLLGIQNLDSVKTAGAAVRRNPAIQGILEATKNTATNSPLSSVMRLLAIRRKGLWYAETHMDRILQGQQLTEKDFENVVWATSARDYSERRSPA